ncbi:MAG: hypothetical protein NVS3B5_14250 [Sphingomicrobium sp.]
MGANAAQALRHSNGNVCQANMEIDMSKAILGLMLATTCISLAGCQVKKTQEGEAPKVSVTGGQLPKYDVKTPDVQVGSKKEVVTVPTVHVKPAN